VHSHISRNLISEKLIVLQKSHHIAEQSKLTIIQLWGLKLNDVEYREKWQTGWSKN